MGVSKNSYGVKTALQAVALNLGSTKESRGACQNPNAQGLPQANSIRNSRTGRSAGEFVKPPNDSSAELGNQCFKPTLSLSVNEAERLLLDKWLN